VADDTQAPRLLIVEDERHIAAGLKLNFELEGYEVHVVGSAREAAAKLVEPEGFDAVLLDVMLPDSDGFSICRKLRDAGDFTPVLMLTARGTTEDRVKGLEAGADDYLVKPFELSELLARVRSMLRRRGWEREVQTSEPPEDMHLGDVRIDFAASEAYRGDEKLRLTRLEIDLLRYFAGNPGRVLSRQELQEKVWQLDNYPNSRMVDNFILRLRKHFEPDPAQPTFFVSVRGSGYKFVPSDKA
jgi:DNA-binding response OmpR family regulator